MTFLDTGLKSNDRHSVVARPHGKGWRGRKREVANANVTRPLKQSRNTDRQEAHYTA
jgi:hypothetical protein